MCSAKQPCGDNDKLDIGLGNADGSVAGCKVCGEKVEILHRFLKCKTWRFIMVSMSY